ncbi:hypothetical protein [Sphingobium yanoikuyae]|nr:hypothetical protein [Sphingobium yanoikuyae]
MITILTAAVLLAGVNGVLLQRRVKRLELQVINLQNWTVSKGQ